MTSLWTKTLFYLGLVDDEQIQAADGVLERSEGGASVRIDGQQDSSRSSKPISTSGVRSRDRVGGRRVEPPPSARRRQSPDPRHSEAGIYVATPQTFGTGTTEVIAARTFSDAQQLADHIRANHPVVLDLRSTEPAMVRRLVDFSTGLAYAIDGRVAKIAQGVILVTPMNSTLELEERRRLAAMGLYEAGTD